MEFSCSNCEYKSNVKNCVIRHINNKNLECFKNNPVLKSTIIHIKCDFCNKTYTTVPILKKHLKTCKVKKENLEEENKKLKEELALATKALSEKPSTINITNNQNNQINIHLTPWNNPTLPENVEKYYNEALKKLFLAVPTIIKQIHFNKDHPENHNISIKNARSGIAKVYNGKEWESMDEKDVINSLINDYESTLSGYAEENNPKYNEKMQKIKDRDSEEKVYDDMHNEVKRVIYDRNHMVKIKN
jgi:hypothetical protein